MITLLHSAHIDFYVLFHRIKDGKCIDLQKKFIPTISYKINFVEPLNKYYTQDGNKISDLNKRKAINIGKQYYNEFNESEKLHSYLKQKKK